NSAQYRRCDVENIISEFGGSDKMLPVAEVERRALVSVCRRDQEAVASNQSELQGAVGCHQGVLRPEHQIEARGICFIQESNQMQRSVHAEKNSFGAFLKDLRDIGPV